MTQSEYKTFLLKTDELLWELAEIIRLHGVVDDTKFLDRLLSFQDMTVKLKEDLNAIARSGK